jgi:hypothetical protein
MMEIPTDLSGVLSEFGLPVGAGVLAWGLVKGADAIEVDAKEEKPAHRLRQDVRRWASIVSETW